MEANKAVLRELSQANAKVNATSRTVGPRKIVDASFLEGQPVHIYSGQKCNSAELQKRALRAAMQGQEGQKLWTYSVGHNSGCFPMLEKDITLGDMLRQSDAVEDSREPFRYPKQRRRADFPKLENNVSEARKDDLRSPWVENQLYPELSLKEVVHGAFDAKSLGTGGAHVIPERRPGLHPPGCRTPAEEPEPLQPPMCFSARVSMGAESLADKYNRSILDGRPQARSIRFGERSVPRSVARKFGTGAQLAEVEAAPVSFNLAERYDGKLGNSDCLTSFMRDVAKPLAAQRATSQGPVAGSGGRDRGAQQQPRGPAAAQADRSFLARSGGAQAWSARASGRLAQPQPAPPLASAR